VLPLIHLYTLHVTMCYGHIRHLEDPDTFQWFQSQSDDRVLDTQSSAELRPSIEMQASWSMPRVLFIRCPMDKIFYFFDLRTDFDDE
jgi:hypothetical protein